MVSDMMAPSNDPDAQFALAALQSSENMMMQEFPLQVDANGNPVMDASGNPVLASAPPPYPAPSASSDVAAAVESNAAATSDSSGGGEPGAAGDVSTDAPLSASSLAAIAAFSSGPAAVRFNSTPGGWVDKLGMLKPIVQGGILPLFGFVGASHLSNCYHLSPQGVFSPQFKHVFLDPTNTSKPTKATQFSLKIATAGAVAVGVYPAVSTKTGQSMASMGSFAIYTPESTHLIEYPTLQAQLFRGLAPWTGSSSQTKNMLMAAASKKKDPTLFRSKWTIDLIPGQGINTAVSSPFIKASAAANANFGNSTFYLQFQPYFVNYNVKYDEEFIVFDYNDAIAQTLVFLTSISGGVALVSGLPKALGNFAFSATTFVQKAMAGDLAGACAAASEVQGAAMKGQGAGTAHGHSMKAAHQGK